METEAVVVERTARAPWLAPALLAGGVVAASSSPILVRYAEGADALAISFWRCFVGALVLLPFARGGLRRVGRRQAALCAIAGIFLALHFGTWITSLGLTTVASSVLLVSTTPIFVALVAPWIVRERLNAAGWAGIVLAFAGTALIAGLDFAGASLLGNALALAGGATAGGYVLAGRLARKDLSIIPYAVITYGVAAVVLAPACLIAGAPLAGYPPGTWIALVALIVGPQLLGHTVINLVLSQIDATTVAVSFMAEPIIATAAAAWLFDEIPSAVFYLGGAAILAGIFLVSSNQRPAEVPPA
ncbi:MAG: DMT family transporter [Actinomycetota bacterium]|nr:DMT family transporter [Actinomycetota bacterium]